MRLSRFALLHLIPSSLACAVLIVAWGCSPAGGGSTGTGGKPGSGGAATASGGASSTGGGSAATGGAVGTGGQPGSGGRSASGGAPSTGGSNAASGGAVGTGGQPGSGGASATGGAAGGSSGVAPLFSEDFESGMAGKQPAGWDNFISYQKNNSNPDGAGMMAVVDTAHAHGGKNAVHFHGGGSPAMLTRPLPTGTNKLYVRGYFYMSRQLGMNPGANHETLIGIRKLPGGANDEVRFGEIKGVIGTNEVPTDNISPKMDQWGKGPVIAANQWACIEVAFLADQPQHTLTAWADGVMVHSITAGDQWQNGVLPMNWMSGKFVELILGWHSFSNATADIWLDDLVVSTARIGCM